MKGDEFRRIALLAIKEEARRKPGERIYVGSKSFTFEEVAEGLDKGDPFLIENFFNPFLKRLKSSVLFRKQVLRMLEVG